MEQRASLITLGVADLARSRRFYVEGLGWTPVMEVEGEVVFFNLSPGLVLGLFTGLVEDAGIEARGPGLSSVALNLPEKGEVDAVLAEAKAAGRDASRSPPATPTGAAAPATSPTRTATCGRSPGTRSGRWTMPGGCRFLAGRRALSA